MKRPEVRIRSIMKSLQGAFSHKENMVGQIHKAIDELRILDDELSELHSYFTELILEGARISVYERRQIYRDICDKL